MSALLILSVVRIPLYSGGLIRSLLFFIYGEDSVTFASQRDDLLPPLDRLNTQQMEMC